MLIAAAAAAAHAQTYPTRTIRVIVGLSPGGSMDVTARLVSDKLKDALGQQIIVENRPGANSVIASELVAKAPPDGYTLMLAGAGSLSIRQKLELKLPFNAERDFAPIVHVVNLPLLLLTPTALPVRSVRELFALARARLGELNYSSSGVPSLPSIAESGVPKYESISWNGFVAPSATPRAVIERLQQEINRLIKTQDMNEKLAAIGGEAVGGTPEQFAVLIKSESARWGRLIDQLGIKAQ